MRHRFSIGKKIGLGFLGILFFALVIFVTQQLWNWLIPELFHGPVITYWQALGLLVLGKLLFGWNGHRGGGWGKRRQWDERLKERMAGMTPEQRERMKEHLRNHCRPGRGPWRRDWRQYPEDETWDNPGQPSAEKDKEQDKGQR
ncbi:hypothetical protein [Chitinophaga solisilvae]|uniref:hypothetical protein n=1 Tax=Chitinophaga solisilvae TaxID=1233460 RepID=UPI00136F3AE0|nr:hypothetical protein [Chitinophaga solisilvae]